MRYTLVLTLVSCAVLVGLLADGSAVARQGRQEDPLTKRVAVLETQLAVAAQALAAEHKAAAEREARLVLVEAWLRSMPAAAQAFQRGLDDVIAKGFTNAGANMYSRELLVNALRGLARNLEQGLQPPKRK